MSDGIIRLIITFFFPIIALVGMKYLEKKFEIIRKHCQLIAGVLFGVVAVLCTEVSANMGGFNINCRDAAPVVAGILYGGPAGIIAGIIGGVERWFAVYWGAGMLTRTTCSFSTIAAGFFATLLRKYVFHNKRPTIFVSLVSGFIIETFHIFTIFISNVKDATLAIGVVSVCYVPMTVSVALATAVCTVIYIILEHDERILERKEPLSDIIQRYLLFLIVFVAIVITAFQFVIQNNLYRNDSQKKLQMNLTSITDDIKASVSTEQSYLASLVCEEIINGNDDLDRLCGYFNFTEMHIVGDDGTVLSSSKERLIGCNFNDSALTKNIMKQIESGKYMHGVTTPSLDGSGEGVYFVRSYGLHKYIVIGENQAAYRKTVSRSAVQLLAGKKLGENGGILIFCNDGIIANSMNTSTEKYVKYLKDSIGNTLFENEIAECEIAGKAYIVEYTTWGEYTIAALIDYKEEMELRDVGVYLFVLSTVLLFGILFFETNIIFDKLFVAKVIHIKDSLEEIAGGNLEVVVNERKSVEFSLLSDYINKTVDALKDQIEKVKNRIAEELEFAKQIQSSCLPSVFPAFPGYDSFNIFASMTTAKEVGGDFYDFYITDSNKLNFVVADVSGKGIPAALFMMRAKTILKAAIERNSEVEQAVAMANDSLCTGNDANMFVTVWQGQLDLDTGELKFVTAGHNPPVIKHKDGTCEFAKQKTSIVLGGMEDMKFHLNSMTLEPGDMLFLYTDGVTEATTNYNELFGDDRLIEAVSHADTTDIEQLCKKVKRKIDDFVNGASQFDDITMLSLIYYGNGEESV